MPSYAIANEEEAEDLICGLALLGTGGGGRPEAGREILLRRLSEGHRPGWTDIDELPREGWVCSVFSMGSVAPRSAEYREGYVPPEYGERMPGTPFARAVRELEAFAGVQIAALVPFEVGAGNSVYPFDAAVELGLCVVDGDGAGRAVPEATQCLPAIKGKSFCPAAICDDWGNVLLLKQASSAALAEALGKQVSIVTKMPDPYAFCSFAAFLMPIAQLPEVVIPGSMTRAFRLGQAVREARASNRDPVQAAADALQGWCLFKGRVSDREWQNSQGYMIGTTTLEGVGEFSGHTLRVWFKNENHITWFDDHPWVTSPDLITIVEAASAESITNTNLQVGDCVAVLGAPHPPLRTAEAVALLGPRHFRFDLDYVPIEELMNSRFGLRAA